MALVSLGQAACNALASWLRSSLTQDVIVDSRWPDPRRDLPPKVVTVVSNGRRRRVPVLPTQQVLSSVSTGSASAQVIMQTGSFTQPIQLDVWCTNTIDRDDIIAQLDVALNAGLSLTMANLSTTEPVRDGLILSFLEQDGYVGNIDYVLDEPDVEDSPDAVQRSEFRATYFGEARAAFSVPADVGIIKTPEYDPTTGFNPVT